MSRPHHVRDVLIDAERIERRVAELVREMVHDCRGENFVLIGILRGSFMFLADLARELHHVGARPRIDFMTLGSYGSGTVSSGTVKVVKDLSVDIRGAEVLLVDDILDTGRTLDFAARHLLELGVGRVKTCAFLDKPSRRVVPFKADYVGFEVPDEFVVGYGLDYDGRYRELPWIAKVTFNP